MFAAGDAARDILRETRPSCNRQTQLFLEICKRSVRRNIDDYLDTTGYQMNDSF